MCPPFAGAIWWHGVSGAVERMAFDREGLAKHFHFVNFHADCMGQAALGAGRMNR
jgi:hypothetical protein